MPVGFIYIVALIDVYSRSIVSWRLSNTVDRHFCLAMLDEALAQDKPEILNTDQGSQFTNHDWVKRVEAAGVQVSMDGQGRWADNVIIERFWRTLKHEHMAYHRFDSVKDLRGSVGNFIDFYNHDRLHSTLGYVPPVEVYRGPVSRPPSPEIVPNSPVWVPNGQIRWEFESDHLGPSAQVA